MPSYSDFSEDYSSDDFSLDTAVRNTTLQSPTHKKQADDASKRYVKKTPHEHVLTRPDSYVGSIEMSTQDIWVYDDGVGMKHRKVNFVPGLYKIFDEILVNAADHKQRDPNMNIIKVELDPENNCISVYNNGEGIPIQIHSEEKIWIPEMIFGHLLTSSNYDDNEKKVTGGRNGYGAKLANIFSNEFTVETVDTKSHKKYKQTWTNNMYSPGKASVTKSSIKKGYTQITFKPDLEKFGMDHLDKDIIALMSKRVYDIAGCNSSVKVYLNGSLIPIRNFNSYCKLYLDKSQKCVFDKINDRWEVCITHSDGQPEQVSFVNSINTIRGGTHVTVIQDKIAKHVIEQVKKKQKKGPNVKPHQVKQQTWIFVNCLIENPTFDSQTKETLTTKRSNFGRDFKPSPDFFKKINSTEIIERVLNYANFREKTQLKKTSGKKKERLTGIKKLCDANDAGSKRYAGDCTLILTEGDSAKTLAISGLSIVGRDRYGVFPLKGKLLNVRDASNKQILENEEISSITKILGLQHGKIYDKQSVKKDLRYGKLMIMADQDHDGSHIKGLLINFIHHFWPSLIKCNIFMQEFITPIIKASKGKNNLSFFTMPEYLNWKKSQNGAVGWKIKYYKGLGTSTATEAKNYFKDLPKHKISFKYTGNENDRLIEMAFAKKKADERKDWIRSINNEETFVDHTSGNVSYNDFINKELVLFSAADCERSIPCLVDGLKPGQRKILFCCFKRKLKNELKVAQLAGYVSEQSAYHHGEASLMGTIISMAQNYVGSNNINLLYPAGQFGTRLMGGKDSASPRYIFTRLSKITRTIFPEHDDNLLEYLDDDGQSIEPKWYMPILPLVLVNGSEGIGTGWSTTIPNYNPRDIIHNLRKLIKGEEIEEMHPWYNGFTGTIEISGKSYACEGVYEEIDEDTIRITELPIRSWTQNYKEFLESLLVDSKGKAPILSDYRDHSGDTTVDFTVKFEPGVLNKLLKSNQLEKKLKLTSTKFSTSNMHLFNANGEIKKYETVSDILREFFDLRLSFYHKRKEWLVKVKREEVLRISNRVRFILMVINDELIVAKKKKSDLLKELEDLKFDKMASSTKKPKAKNAIQTEEELEDSRASYDYLLSMPLWNLTWEKVEKLKKEEEERKQELHILLETTKEQMWLQDLDEFETTLTQFQDDVALANKQSIRKKEPTTIKGRAKRKPVAKKQVTKKSTASSTIKKTSTTRKTKKITVDSSEEYNSDDDYIKTTSSKKKKPTTSDISVIFGQTGKKRNPPKTTTKKPPTSGRRLLQIELSESESDDDELANLKLSVGKKKTSPSSSTTLKSKSKPKPKPKEPESDSEMEILLSSDSESESIEFTRKPKRTNRSKAIILESDSEEDFEDNMSESDSEFSY